MRWKPSQKYISFFLEATNASLILTSDQLAQLSNGGVWQIGSSGATAANAVVIKSEPNPLTLGATPTVQNVSAEDVRLFYTISKACF